MGICFWRTHEDATIQPFPRAFALVLGKATRKDKTDVIVCVPVWRDLLTRTMGTEGQQLAARGMCRDHVVGDAKIKRVRFVPHWGEDSARGEINKRPEMVQAPNLAR